MDKLHLLVVSAGSPEQACARVESIAFLWAGIGNRFSVCGCVSEDDKVYSTGEGRFDPMELGLTTIAALNAYVTGKIKRGHEKEATALLRDLGVGKVDESEWFVLKSPCEEVTVDLGEEATGVDSNRRAGLNVLEDEFAAWDFDHFGITQDGGEEQGKKYVVLLHMHR